MASDENELAGCEDGTTTVSTGEMIGAATVAGLSCLATIGVVATVTTALGCR